MLDASISIHASTEIVALMLLSPTGFLRWLVVRLQKRQQ